MLAVNPLLTPNDIDQLLAGTHPATTIRITRDLGSVGRDDLYGHGLIDASQAVIAAKAIPGGVGGRTPAGSILGVSNLSLDFSNFIDSLPIDLTNAGIGTINVTQVTSSASWLTVTPSSGTAPLTINAAVDRSGLIEGDYTAAIQITSDAGQNPTATTQVKIRVGGNTLGNVGTVFVLVIDAQSLKTVQETEASVAEGYSFTTPKIPAGTYFIVAGTDRNNDHFICDPEDACGFYPDRISITSDKEIPNINFIVEALVSPQSTASVAGQLKGKTFRRLN
jgi:serine protease